ncbi:TadE/TadG family type IV pilus assembly protein [Paraburkholderia pallida]|uniref:Pilus assembly protein n=1 Tax=Paraburkholderia pallida TaxID=2547399 RepID=A0A4P7CT60_9BURK|nr:TadE/TadG family type IV pilus assembly protein [Paraburkholderia pallida]QBQ98307.1 pilus assembly protein [Paraburkholderia pallida]
MNNRNRGGALRGPSAGRRARRRDQRGAAVVEFALILPLLLLIFFAIVEFGFILYDKTAITSASRAAVRQAVAFGENSTGTPVYLTASTVQGIAQNGLSTMLINFASGTTTPGVTITNSSSGTVTGSTQACSTGASVTVAVSYTFTGLALGGLFNPLPAALKNALTLTSSTTMSCE